MRQLPAEAFPEEKTTAKKVDCDLYEERDPYLKNSIAVLTCKVADINDRFNHVMFLPRWRTL